MKSRQMSLFPTAEWEPKPKRRKRPQDLLELIRNMQGLRFGCKPKVSWFAGEMGVCARTIQRWLRLLSSEISQVIRGWHRSAVYKITHPSPPNSPPLKPQVSPQNVTPDVPVHYYSIPGTICTKSAPTTKPAKAGASLTKRVSEKIQQAASRIKRAKNPYAYRQAVLKHERELESADLWYAEEAQKKPVSTAASAGLREMFGIAFLAAAKRF